MASSPLEQNLLRIIRVQLSNTFSNGTEVAQWATPSCSRKLPAWAMASETVDPIDCPLTLTLMGRWVTSDSLVHSINRCSLCRESIQQPSAYEAITLLLNVLFQLIYNAATFQP